MKVKKYQSVAFNQPLPAKAKALPWLHWILKTLELFLMYPTLRWDIIPALHTEQHFGDFQAGFRKKKTVWKTRFF